MELVGWFGREGWRVWMGSEGENSVMVWVRRIQGRPDTGFKGGGGARFFFDLKDPKRVKIND